MKSNSANDKPDMLSSAWHRHPDTDAALYTSQYEEETHLVHDDLERDIEFVGLKLSRAGKTINDEHKTMALYQTKAGRLIGEIKVISARNSAPIMHRAHLFDAIVSAAHGEHQITEFFGMSEVAKIMYSDLHFEVKYKNVIE